MWIVSFAIKKWWFYTVLLVYQRAMPWFYGWFMSVDVPLSRLIDSSEYFFIQSPGLNRFISSFWAPSLCLVVIYNSYYGHGSMSIDELPMKMMTLHGRVRLQPRRTKGGCEIRVCYQLSNMGLTTGISIGKSTAMVGDVGSPAHSIDYKNQSKIGQYDLVSTIIYHPLPSFACDLPCFSHCFPLFPSIYHHSPIIYLSFSYDFPESYPPMTMMNIPLIWARQFSPSPKPWASQPLRGCCGPGTWW